MEKSKKQKGDIGFLYKHLALGAEIRGEEPKGKYPKGRVKQVFDVFSAEMNSLMRVNAWVMLFTIPLFFVLYWYSNYATAQAIAGFNFMGNIGMAYPGVSDDAVNGLIATYHAYQNVLYLVVPSLLIMSIGFAGAFNCYKAFMWGEKLPKITKPFFRGVKKYWWKYAVVTLIDAGIILSVGSTVLYFLEMRALGTATAGIWVLMIFVCIAAFLLLYVNMQLLPILCEVDLPFFKQVKDALIFSIKYAIIGLPIFLLCLVPLALLFVGSSFIMLILIVLVVMFGFILYGLIFTAISQSALDNVLTPLYEMSLSPADKGKKAKKQPKAITSEEKPAAPVQNVKKEIAAEKPAEAAVTETVEAAPAQNPNTKNVNANHNKKYNSYNNSKSKGKKNGGK